MLLPWLRRFVSRPAAKNTPRPKTRWKHYRPWIEDLEGRITPAFNLTLSTLATNAAVTVSNPDAQTTQFTATATGANVSWNDVAAALAAGQNVVIDSGSTGAEAGNITDQGFGSAINNAAGTSLTLQSGSGTGLVGDVSLGNIDLTDPSSAVIVTAAGTVSGGTVTATTLTIQAGTGIGSANTPLQTQVSNLGADSSGTGGIFISNGAASAVTLNVAGTDGVRVTGASGDIGLTNNGNLNINAGGDIVQGPGDVTVTTTGGNILLGGDNGAGFDSPTGAVASSGGTTTIQAAGNLLIGDTGSQTYGDVEGGGSIVLKAGGNINIDDNSLVSAHGTGTITATAGGDISLLHTDMGPTDLVTQGGAISLTTGANGTLTVAGGGGSFAINTTRNSGNGDVTINADHFVLNSSTDSINAGAGTVTIQQVTGSEAIQLGTATDAELDLSNAELGAITAGTLRLGATGNTGDITVTAGVSVPHVGTLSLLTGGGVSETGSGALTVTNLAVVSANAVALTNPNNNIGNLAANVTGAGATFAVNDGTNTLTIPNAGVDGVSGVTTNGANITLQADNVVIKQVVTPGPAADTTDRVILEPFTPTLNITLGTASVPGSTFGITNGGLGWITSGVTQVGTGADTGTIAITGAINRTPTLTAPSRSQILDLETGNATANAVTQTAALSVANLAVRSAGAVALTNPGNAIDNLAAKVTGAGATFAVNDGTNTLTIPPGPNGVDGLLGITTNGANITLQADSVVIRQVVTPGPAADTTDRVILEPFTTTLNITLGTASVPGSTFGVTNGGLSWVTSGVTQVGTGADTGTIAITGAINRTPNPGNPPAGNPAAPSRSQILDLETGNATADAVTQTAALSVANLAVRSAGAVTLTNANNLVDTLAANVTGAGQGFSFTDSGPLTVGTVDGLQGVTTNGGAVTITTTAGLTVNQPVSTTPGSGGSVSISGAVTLNAALTPGAGNIGLNGGGGATADIVINANQTYATPVNLTANRDIIVAAVLKTTGAGSDISLVADADNNGTGGVWVKAAGQVNSSGKALLQGADVFATATSLDSVLVDNNGNTNQVLGADDITIQNDGAAPAGADVILNGAVQASGAAAIKLAAQHNIDESSTLTSASGTITLNSPVVLTGDAQLTSTVSGNITFVSTVDSVAGHNYALTTATDGTMTFKDAVGSKQALGALTAMGDGPNNGTTDLNGGSVTTTGPQAYDNAVVLSGGNFLTTTTAAGSITFASTIDSNSSTTPSILPPWALTITTGTTTAAGVTTGATTTFDGLVGNTNPLLSLTVNGGGAGNNIGATDLNAPANLAATPAVYSVTTTEFQVYNEPVTLTADTALRTTTAITGFVTFASTIDSDADATPRALTIAAAATVTFEGAVGATHPLASLTITGSGGGGGGAPPGTDINGPGLTTTNGQSYGSVVLTHDTVLTSKGAGTIAFAGTVDSSAGNHYRLTTITDGTTIFDNPVGGGQSLRSLTTKGFGATSNGTTDLSAAANLAATPAVYSVTTADFQTYDNTVVLTADTALASTTAAGNITFASTVDSDADATPRALTVTTGTTTVGGVTTGATAAFDGLVGHAHKLASLTVNGGGAGNAVGTTDLNAAGTAAGPSVTTTGAQAYNDTVVLTADTALTSTTAAGNVTFASTVDSDSIATLRALAVTTGTTTTGGVTTGATASFDGLVGSNARLASLTVSGGGANGAVGSTVLNAAGTPALPTVTTDAFQTYNDAVTLMAATALTSKTAAGNVTFGSTVDSDADATPRALAVTTGTTTAGGVTAGATATFDGLVGHAHKLASLTVNGGGAGNAIGSTDLNAAGTPAAPSVTTTGAQTYNDTVVLTADTALTSTTAAGNVTFASTVDSDSVATLRALAVTTGTTTTGGVTTGATASFDGLVGSNARLASLTVSGGGANGAVGSTVLNAAGTPALPTVTTDAFQTYNDAVVLTAATVLTSKTSVGNIKFASTIDSNSNTAPSNATPRALTISAGATASSAATTVEFDGLVGHTNPLASLTVNAGGTSATPGTTVLNAAGTVTLPSGGTAGSIAVSSITTTGAQTYNEPVTLTANSVLTSTNTPEVQTITVTGTAGTFTLTFNGKTTGALAFNASAATVQSALNGLSTIGGVGGSVSVTQSGNVYTVTFAGSLAGAEQPPITATGSGGTTVQVAGAAITLASTVALGSNTLTLNNDYPGTATILGAISGSAASGLTKWGSSILTLPAGVTDAGFAGTTTVVGGATTFGAQTYVGTLLVESNLSASQIVLDAAQVTGAQDITDSSSQVIVVPKGGFGLAVLAGSGTVGGISADSSRGGVVAPGPLFRTAPQTIYDHEPLVTESGILTSDGGVTLNNHVAFVARLNGTGGVSGTSDLTKPGAGNPNSIPTTPVPPTAGRDYDQLSLKGGTFTAGGAKLEPTLGTASYVGDSFRVVSPGTDTNFVLSSGGDNVNFFLRNQQFKLTSVGTDVVLAHLETAPTFASISVKRDPNSPILTLNTAGDANLLNTVNDMATRLGVLNNGDPSHYFTLFATDVADQAWKYIKPDELDAPQASVDLGDLPNGQDTMNFARNASATAGQIVPPSVFGAALQGPSPATAHAETLPDDQWTFANAKAYTAQVNAALKAQVTDSSPAPQQSSANYAYTETVLDTPLYDGTSGGVLPVSGSAINNQMLASFASLGATVDVAHSQQMAGNFKVVVDWGDGPKGNPDLQVAAPNSSLQVTWSLDKNGRPVYRVMGSHTFPVAGKWIVKVYVTDPTNPAISSQTAPSQLLGPSVGNPTILAPVSAVAFTGTASTLFAGQVINQGLGTPLTGPQLALFQALGLGTAQLNAAAQNYVIENALFTQPALQNTVNQLLTQFGLTADPVTYNSYVQFLAHGGTRQQLAIRIAASPQFVNQFDSFGNWLVNMYVAYFNMHYQAGPFGIIYTVSAQALQALATAYSQANNSYLAAANAALSSPSGDIAEVIYMYGNFLGRFPMANELTHWTTRLQQTNENEVEREFLSDPGVISALQQNTTTNTGELQAVGEVVFPWNFGPAVIAQPLDQIARAGQSATFTAGVASSTLDRNFQPRPAPVQWQVRLKGATAFTNIPGATSVDLVLAPGGPFGNLLQDGNQFQAVFTDILKHKVTTSPAKLTIIP